MNNREELDSFVVLDVFAYSQIHDNREFDGHLVYSNTNVNTFTDYVKPDPMRVLPRTVLILLTGLVLTLLIFLPELVLTVLIIAY